MVTAEVVLGVVIAVMHEQVRITRSNNQLNYTYSSTFALLSVCLSVCLLRPTHLALSRFLCC